MKKWETPELSFLGVDQTKAGIDFDGVLYRNSKSTCRKKGSSSSSDSSQDGASGFSSCDVFRS